MITPWSVAIVEMGRGPDREIDWLEYGEREDGVCHCWLAGEPPGELATPVDWTAPEPGNYLKQGDPLPTASGGEETVLLYAGQAYGASESGRPRVFGRLTVSLVHDNIAARKADVLVNAANDQLQMGGGVAGALRSRGGIEIHQEAIRHAPAKLGSVIRTGAGALDARYVYHAVVIDYEIRTGTSAVDVALVVRGLVKKAAEDSVASMAMPLFGAGVGGLSVEASLTTILEAIEASASTVPHALSVEIVVREADEFAQAEAVFSGHLGQEAREAEEARLAEEAIRKLLQG